MQIKCRSKKQRKNWRPSAPHTQQTNRKHQVLAQPLVARRVTGAGVELLLEACRSAHSLRGVQAREFVSVRQAGASRGRGRARAADHDRHQRDLAEARTCRLSNRVSAYDRLTKYRLTGEDCSDSVVLAEASIGQKDSGTFSLLFPAGNTTPEPNSRRKLPEGASR